MRKNFRNVGFYPQPVLVVGTYDQDGIPDAMNVGWGGLVGGTYVELNISRGHGEHPPKAGLHPELRRPGQPGGGRLRGAGLRL